MIYDTVGQLAKNYLAPLQQELDAVTVELEANREMVKTEDSKRREAELKDKIASLRIRQNQLWSAISRVETEVFQAALAKEYGVVGNPKFGRAFSIAWSMGHSSGFSEVENYFSELVDLIK